MHEPCPFCGADETQLTPSGLPGCRYICCIGCSAQGPTERTTAQAWANWDARKTEEAT